MPTLCLLARAVFDYDLISFKDCLLPWVIVFLSITLILGLLLRSQKNDHRKRSAWFSVLLFALVYSYGAVIACNAGYDYSIPKIYKSKVMDKNFKADTKHIEYDITITPWKLSNDTATESVTYDLYQHVEKGDSININVKQGYLNIPWYYLDK